MFEATCKIDVSNLVRAHAILHKKSRQLPSECLHRTVAFVIKDAKDHTKATSISRIDSELGAISSPKILKSGRLSRAKDKQRTEVEVDEQSLASRIVLARLHPISRGFRGGPGYNQVTGQQWAIDQASFSPGMGVSGFWSRLLARAESMVKTRHSSPGFFKISWNAIGQRLIPLVPAAYQGSVTSWFGKVDNKNDTLALGDVIPARQGELTVTCTVMNKLGMSGSNAVLDNKRNAAMHRILGPILQASINREADSKMREAHRQGFAEARDALAKFGLYVN